MCVTIEGVKGNAKYYKNSALWGSLIYSVGLIADSPRVAQGFPEAIGIQGKIECWTASRGVHGESETVNQRAPVVFDVTCFEIHA